MEITEATQVWSAPRRVRRWLAGASAPPSLQAQLVLMISALLLGAVLASLLFVGIWRHTAADGQRARAAQLADRQQLRVTQTKLASVAAAQASERAALAKARQQQAATAAELARLRQLHHAVAAEVQPELQALEGTTGTVVRHTSALKSEIVALRAYLRSAAPAGADTGFLNTQLSYLVASAERASAASSALDQEAQRATGAAAKLGRATH